MTIQNRQQKKLKLHFSSSSENIDISISLEKEWGVSFHDTRVNLFLNINRDNYVIIKLFTKICNCWPFTLLSWLVQTRLFHPLSNIFINLVSNLLYKDIFLQFQDLKCFFEYENKI